MTALAAILAASAVVAWCCALPIILAGRRQRPPEPT